LPKQGSAEWLQSRRLGGSSAAPILGVGKFSSARDVALEMLGHTTFTGSIATYWGTVFEEAAKKYLSVFVNIFEIGSVPGFGAKKNGEPLTSYSPDGIFIGTEELDELLPVGGLAGKIVLLEIKCPFMRKITPEVPEYYLPQLQLGLATIPVAEVALFTQFNIRACSLSDFGFGTATKSFSFGAAPDTQPIAIGLIIFEDEIGGRRNRFESEVKNEAAINDPHDPYECGEYLRGLEGAFPLALEIEKYMELISKFHPPLVAEIMRINYPPYEGIDLAATPNFVYASSTSEPEELFCALAEAVKSGKFFVPDLLIERTNTWAAREYLRRNLGGRCVLPFKIFHAEMTPVAKTDFSAELNKIISFGLELEDLREKSSEEQLEWAKKK